ncbi:MAG TPA: multifunctional CCA addition/repair protein [Steroidobacteraceae bacterium]|jgi:tRNA nucleotidyltransferase (CCA-adding enzyme)|nr:multifunctional CCA addition/repair protein [Steroidobacteraceae bacterium]
MQVYLVGGAVRDALLGLAVKERDWVVVGGTREELLRLNYREVGRDFPVFLHPDTREEYALARLERKVGPGYRGFSVEFGPEVTLEEDLARRDLTINAIAQSADGSLLDPHGGKRDLEARVLRHVSPAFAEDPVRVLRVARFAARLSPLGFRVAPETLELMRVMVERREIDALVPERVWQETEKALREPKASEFFRVLRACGALQPIYPEIEALFGVPQPARWHPEIDTGLHTLMVLDQAALLSSETTVRFAALVHDLGKGTTPREDWPSHPGHEERSVSLIRTMAERLRLPGEYRDLSLIVARYHGNVHRAFELKPKTILEFMERADAFRRPDRFAQALLACEADSRGRTGLENEPYPQREYLHAARDAAAAIKPSAEDIAAYPGAKIAENLHRRRLHAIAELRGHAAARSPPG